MNVPVLLIRMLLHEIPATRGAVESVLVLVLYRNTPVDAQN